MDIDPTPVEKPPLEAHAQPTQQPLHEEYINSLKERQESKQPASVAQDDGSNHGIGEGQNNQPAQPSEGQPAPGEPEGETAPPGAPEPSPPAIDTPKTPAGETPAAEVLEIPPLKV